MSYVVAPKLLLESAVFFPMLQLITEQKSVGGRASTPIRDNFLVLSGIIKDVESQLDWVRRLSMIIKKGFVGLRICPRVLLDFFWIVTVIDGSRAPAGD